jgi:hypothetical protein
VDKALEQMFEMNEIQALSISLQDLFLQNQIYGDFNRIFLKNEKVSDLHFVFKTNENIDLVYSVTSTPFEQDLILLVCVITETSNDDTLIQEE